MQSRKQVCEQGLEHAWNQGSCQRTMEERKGSSEGPEAPAWCTNTPTRSTTVKEHTI